MVRVALLCVLLAGCAPLTLSQIEVGLNGGVKKVRSGGEHYASDTTGHYEEEWQWFTGGDIRFIFGRNK